MSILHSEGENILTEDNLACLANPRRREIIAVLQEQDTPIDRRELAEKIVAAEQDVPLDAISEQAIENVLLTFHHNHLPRLEDAGYIEYDDQQYRITSEMESKTAEGILGEL